MSTDDRSTGILWHCRRRQIHRDKKALSYSISFFCLSFPFIWGILPPSWKLVGTLALTMYALHFNFLSCHLISSPSLLDRNSFVLHAFFSFIFRLFLSLSLSLSLALSYLRLVYCVLRRTYLLSIALYLFQYCVIFYLFFMHFFSLLFIWFVAELCIIS